MAFPESWQEVALLSIKTSLATQNFALITESIDVTHGDKQVEGMATVAGGRIMKWTPETDTEFTAKIYPVGVGRLADTSSNGFWQIFQPSAAASGVADTYPQNVSVSRIRNTYSVALMWSQSLPADAFAPTTGSPAAYRTILRNAWITKFKESFSPSDGYSGDITIVCPPFAKDGSINITKESTDGSIVLPQK